MSVSKMWSQKRNCAETWSERFNLGRKYPYAS